ncbi:MAG: hypothetical protein R2822_28425 [Spirosomataceae bacterium]
MEALIQKQAKLKTEEDKVAIYMIGASRNGKAYDLKNKLNAFVDQMNKIGGRNFSSLALDGKDDPLTQKDPEQNGKDFASLNFEQTPSACGVGRSEPETIGNTPL